MGRKTKSVTASKDDQDVLVDLTEPLKLTSKRTKRQQTKIQKKRVTFRQFPDLHQDAVMCILDYCTPRTIWALSQVCRGLGQLIRNNETYLANRVIALRYPNISKGFQLPYLMTQVIDTCPDPNILQALDIYREKIIPLRVRLRHIPGHPVDTICSCTSCIDRWNMLCLAVDFAIWQDDLDNGTPLPRTDWGFPCDPWRQPDPILSRCRRRVINALHSPLLYSMILESHLESTVRAIRRQRENKSNRSDHFPMTSKDASSGTDRFLSKEGPSFIEAPYTREMYYMLEVFLPGRAWNKTDKEWKYLMVPHERELEIVQSQIRKHSAGAVFFTITCRMDDIYSHFCSQRLWDQYDVPKAPTIEVTELWVDPNDKDATSVIENRSFSSSDIDNWLDETCRKSFPSARSTYNRAVRILWVGQNPKTGRASPSSHILDRLSVDWGLQNALGYAQSSFAGVSSLPGASPSVYTVTYHPKLAVAWSHSSHSASKATPKTDVIIFAEGESRTELQRILKSSWRTSISSHPMFPALLCSLLLGHELDTTLNEIKNIVREVEARTGHHRFTSRRETQPAAGELGHLSAQMSGCAAKLANGTRKLRVVEEINNLVSRHFYEDQEKWIELVSHRTDMQQTDLTYTSSRVDVQIRALFHLIAQQDNAIAFDTASATRSIAASSLQDSSSMKMLALVAMFFLPGSFVAALFSTPLFEYQGYEDKMGLGTRPQFVLFWVVTTPLTVGVFIMYFVWMWRQKKKDKKRRRKGLDVGLHVLSA
ncbi:hypothetical protein QBC44DRAFT_288756 [Cladorrhinum sp. PSN332]|nr:hypothetical protein QBC44DRAFT_288756 [Cladorrhinum sp. PSN332]